MMLGVEDPLELPLAVVGKALAEGTIVGFSEDIVWLVVVVGYRSRMYVVYIKYLDRVVYRYRCL
jgi:hypothetical protein